MAKSNPALTIFPPSPPHRCQLFLQPAGRLEGQYGPSATCISWKEQVHCSSEVRSLLQCPPSDSSFLPLMVTTLAVPDDLRFIACQGEDEWDPAYIIHLHPSATLRNLLPYTIRYLLEVSLRRHIGLGIWVRSRSVPKMSTNVVCHN